MVCRAKREKEKKRDRERETYGELAYGNGARDSIITETRLIKDAQLKSSAVRSLGSFVHSFVLSRANVGIAAPT